MTEYPGTPAWTPADTCDLLVAGVQAHLDTCDLVVAGVRISISPKYLYLYLELSGSTKTLPCPKLRSWTVITERKDQEASNCIGTVLWLSIKYKALRRISLCIQNEHFAWVLILFFAYPIFFLCKIHDNKENNDGEYHTNYITSSHAVNKVTFRLCSILLQFLAVAILQTTKRSRSLPGLTRSSDNSELTAATA